MNRLRVRYGVLSLIIGFLTSPVAGQAPRDEPRSAATLEAAYHIVLGPPKKARATYTMKIESPKFTAQEWIIFAAQPPASSSQLNPRAKLQPAGEPYAELSPLARTILRGLVVAQGKPALRKGITVKLELEAELRARHLVGPDQARQDSKWERLRPEPLDDNERALWLRKTPLVDFESQEFQAWFEKYKLTRTADEDAIAYARRAFQTLERNMAYEYTAKMDRRASNVCRSGRSDCGGLSVLYCAILRSQRVPARCLVGRWTKPVEVKQPTGLSRYNQEHVKAEFYADGVGWVPVDCASGVQYDRSAERLYNFGHDQGDFLVLHLDPEIEVDTLRFGKHSIVWLQGCAYWVAGNGKFDDVTQQEDWVVEPGR